METKTYTIRPGILVALKTSVQGGVEYERQDIAKSDDKTMERWETTRRCENPEDYETACTVRGAAAAVVRGVCSKSSFGLLCPMDKEPELNLAVEKALNLANEHNLKRTGTTVKIYVLKGRVASDDEQAARGIASDMKTLIVQMHDAIGRLDPAAIRKAANEAKQMLQVLSADKQEAASKAIEAARKAAREITKRVEKAGEPGAAVLDDLKRELGTIQSGRMSFLETDEQTAAPAAPELPQVEMQRFAELDVPASGEQTGEPAQEPVHVPAPERALDLSPTAEPVAAEAAPVRELDLADESVELVDAALSLTDEPAPVTIANPLSQTSPLRSEDVGQLASERAFVPPGPMTSPAVETEPAPAGEPDLSTVYDGDVAGVDSEGGEI